MTMKLRLTIILTVLGTAGLAGCGSDLKPYDPSGKNDRKNFFFPVRQLAPDPVYNRIKVSYLPEVLPPRDVETSPDAPKVFPVIHLDLKNVTLETATQTIAATARYRSFCSGIVAKNKVTINTLGTIDELAAELSKKADVTVVVDHDNREIRLFQKEAVKPELPSNEVLSGKVESDEHKSYY